MTVTLEIPESLEPALKQHATARGLSESQLIVRIVQQELADLAARALEPEKSLYGILAKYGPGPTDEEIDQNRREMFGSFGERDS